MRLKDIRFAPVNFHPASIWRSLQQRPALIKILSNIGWLTADKLLRMGMGLLVGVWVARYLGPEQFGLINYASAFVSLFAVVATLGLNSIVVRDLVAAPDHAGLTLGTAAMLQLLGGLLAFVLVLVSIWLARPDDGTTQGIVAILGSSLLFKATETASYWFEAQVQSKYIVWANNAAFLTFIAVKIILILANAPLITFVWAMLGETALAALAVVAMFMSRGPGLTLLSVQSARARTLLRDSWPLILSGLAIAFYMKIDQIMLGQMLGDEAVGIYSAAVRISEVWYFIPMSIVASLFPAIIDAKTISESLYYQRFQRLYDLMVWLSLAIALPMTFLSNSLITFLYGTAYAEAGLVLAVHIWASVFVFLGVASGQWFIVENRQILSLQRTALGAFVNVGLNLILIPGLGILGAAMATVVAQSAAAIFFDLLNRETRPIFAMKMRALNPLRLGIANVFHS